MIAFAKFCCAFGYFVVVGCVEPLKLDLVDFDAVSITSTDRDELGAVVLVESREVVWRIFGYFDTSISLIDEFAVPCNRIAFFGLDDGFLVFNVGATDSLVDDVAVFGSICVSHGINYSTAPLASGVAGTETFVIFEQDYFGVFDAGEGGIVGRL